MSAFDLAGDHDSASLIDQARANPLDLSQPAGFFTGMGTGLVTGLGRLAADTQRTAGLALGAVAGSFDMLTGDAIKAQDKVFEHLVTPADRLSRHLAPKAEEIGMAGQLLHGLIKIGGEAVAFGAPGVLVNETIGGTLDALDKGVDLQTAAKVGGVQGAAMTAGVIAPMTLGSTGLGMNLLYGAGINLAQGVFQRGATSEIYARAGRPDLAMQFQALDKEAMAVDAILGAAFAGGGRALQLRGEKAKADAMAEYRAKIADMLKPSDIDAALVKSEQLKIERPGFGLPADLASRDSHVANMRGAIDDLIEGRPVTMRQPVGDFIPDEAAAKVQEDVSAVLAPEITPKVGADTTAAGQARQGDVVYLGDFLTSRHDDSGLPLESAELPIPPEIRNKILAAYNSASEGGETKLGRIEDSDNIQAKTDGFRAMAEAEGYTVGGDYKYLTISKNGVSLKVRLSDHANVNKGIHFGENVINIAPSDGSNPVDTFSSALYIMRHTMVDADGEIVITRDAPAAVNERLGFVVTPQGGHASTAAGSDAKTTGTIPEAQALDANAQPATSLKPDAVIPLDDADATTTVAEAQGIIADLETAAREQETGLRAAVACFLRAA
mgnify:CR=1 FL=1